MAASRQIDIPGEPLERNQKAITLGIRIYRFLKFKMPSVHGNRGKKTAKTRKQGRDAENRRARPEVRNSVFQEETLTTCKEAQTGESSATSLEGRGSNRYQLQYVKLTAA
ncbi:hypothetical protein NDU88_004555 [Pleurodeles waltl]|uniref:Uncharacterized protein n=1 Tax=Pleurodeles waltl TaxID=8319 RepID=A0AAV7RLX8_PLEWA|nr:hypothetical protein NDU88_004555 [Pleurodeles waltl]